jgi:hypothetical protein
LLTISSSYLQQLLSDSPHWIRRFGQGMPDGMW